MSTTQTKAAGPREGPTTKLRASRQLDTTSPAGGKPSFTTGRAVFFNAAGFGHSISEMRQVLEIKYAAVLVAGGANGYPLHINRIRNPHVRAIAGAGMICKRWSVKDLTECTGLLEGAASSALLASLDRPEWGPSDFHLLGHIEKLEAAATAARGGGRTL